MKKTGIGFLVLIFLMLVIFLLFNNKIHYDTLYRIEPENLSSTDYVPLESGGSILTQVINLNREVGYLKDIEVILVNLPEETNDDILNVRITKNGKTIKKVKYHIEEANAGEWAKIPIGKTLYPGCEYRIEFSIQNENKNDIPYLVTQEVAEASPYHKQLLLNDEILDKSVVISYNFYNVIPFDVKLIISVLCLIMVGGIVCYLFKKNYIDSYAEYIIPAIFLIMLIPIFVISIYSRPCAGDFNYSKAAHQVIETGNYNVIDLLKAAYETDKQFYATWQGLYTSTFLLALQPGIFGNRYYFIGAVSLLIFMYITLYLSVGVIKKRFCENREKTWLWSLLLFSIIVQGMPSAVQGIYLYNSAVNYMLFVFLVIINMTLMLEYAFSEGTKSIVYTVVSALLSFVISGGNHVTSFLNIIGLFIICIILLPRKKIGVLFSTASALLGFWIMYRAPGTALSWSVLAKSTVLITVIESGKKCLENMANWMNIQWACYLLLLLPFSFEIVYHCKKKELKWHPLILFLVSIIILTGMHCVPYYAGSYFGEGGLQNVIWVTFIILSGINMTYLLVWLENKRNFEFIKNCQNIKLNFYAIMCSLVLCWFGSNGLSTSIQVVNEMFSIGVADSLLAEDIVLGIDDAKYADDGLLYVQISLRNPKDFTTKYNRNDYKLSYHILDFQENVIQWDNNRTQINKWVDNSSQEMIIDTTQIWQSDYVIQFDVVQEGVEWLSDRGNSFPSLVVHDSENIEQCQDLLAEDIVLGIDNAKYADDGLLYVQIRLRNPKDSTTKYNRNDYKLSYHILDFEENVIQWDNNRTQINKWVDCSSQEMIIDTTQIWQSDYVIQFDVVQEGVEWLSDRGNSFPSLVVHDGEIIEQ